MRNRHLKIAAMMAMWLLPLAAARAGTVLYNDAGFIEGEQSFVQSFDITSPGTLTITLTSIPWLDTISDLNAFVSTTSGVLGSSWSGGTESMWVKPGMVYTHLFGDADGAFGLGVYGLKVEFQPNGIPAVALPASFFLLLSGLGVLFGWRHRRSPLAGRSQVQYDSLTTQ
jgi:hypothetical protein